MTEPLLSDTTPLAGQLEEETKVNQTLNSANTDSSISSTITKLHQEPEIHFRWSRKVLDESVPKNIRKIIPKKSTPKKQ